MSRTIAINLSKWTGDMILETVIPYRLKLLRKPNKTKYLRCQGKLLTIL